MTTVLQLMTEGRALARIGFSYEAGLKYELAGDLTKCRARQRYCYHKARELYAKHWQEGGAGLALLLRNGEDEVEQARRLS